MYTRPFFCTVPFYLKQNKQVKYLRWVHIKTFSTLQSSSNQEHFSNIFLFSNLNGFTSQLIKIIGKKWRTLTVKKIQGRHQVYQGWTFNYWLKSAQYHYYHTSRSRSILTDKPCQKVTLAKEKTKSETGRRHGGHNSRPDHDLSGHASQLSQCASEPSERRRRARRERERERKRKKNFQCPHTHTRGCEKCTLLPSAHGCWSLLGHFSGNTQLLLLSLPVHDYILEKPVGTDGHGHHCTMPEMQFLQSHHALRSINKANPKKIHTGACQWQRIWTGKVQTPVLAISVLSPPQKQNKQKKLYFSAWNHSGERKCRRRKGRGKAGVGVAANSGSWFQPPQPLIINELQQTQTDQYPGLPLTIPVLWSCRAASVWGGLLHQHHPLSHFPCSSFWVHWHCSC